MISRACFTIFRKTKLNLTSNSYRQLCNRSRNSSWS